MASQSLSLWNLWVAYIWRSGSEAVYTSLWVTKLVNTSFGFGTQPMSLARSSPILLSRTNSKKKFGIQHKPTWQVLSLPDGGPISEWLRQAPSRTFYYRVSFRKDGIQQSRRTFILTFCHNQTRAGSYKESKATSCMVAFSEVGGTLHLLSQQGDFNLSSPQTAVEAWRMWWN